MLLSYSSLLQAAAAVPQGSWALVEPDVSGTVAEKQFVHEDLDIAMEYQSPKQLPPQAAAQARASLLALSAPPDSGKVDVRGGRFSTVTTVKSMVPGSGMGNKLTWDNDNEWMIAAARLPTLKPSRIMPGASSAGISKKMPKTCRLIWVRLRAL